MGFPNEKTDISAASAYGQEVVGIPEKAAKDKPEKPIKPSKKNIKKKKGFIYSWTFKVILISLVMTAFFSLLSEMTMTVSHGVVIVLIILFLIIAGIFFDAIGVAVTSCDLGPLTAMASKKVKAAKMAIKLVNNAEKVASFCSDVIGDIFGIISGACIVALAARIVAVTNAEERILTIVLSCLTAAATIGGKSYVKGLAIRRSKDFVMFAARIINVFKKEK
ncbi:MAG: hypothetical protein LBT30_05320 [Clostridiales bacterium]|jgi:hypothetical protein|nr:hypothetical protein [Clostridiales bacterium]